MASAATPVVTMTGNSIPTTSVGGGSTRNGRDLRAKGFKSAGGKGKGSSDDCIPLYPTPAPTKGKGSSIMKGSNSTSTKGSGLSFKGKGSTNSTSTKGSKGSSSMAPVSRTERQSMSFLSGNVHAFLLTFSCSCHSLILNSHTIVPMLLRLCLPSRLPRPQNPRMCLRRLLPCRPLQLAVAREVVK